MWKIPAGMLSEYLLAAAAGTAAGGAVAGQHRWGSSEEKKNILEPGPGYVPPTYTPPVTSTPSSSSSSSSSSHRSIPEETARIRRGVTQIADSAGISEDEVRASPVFMKIIRNNQLSSITESPPATSDPVFTVDDTEVKFEGIDRYDDGMGGEGGLGGSAEAQDALDRSPLEDVEYDDWMDSGGLAGSASGQNALDRTELGRNMSWDDEITAATADYAAATQTIPSRSIFVRTLQRARVTADRMRRIGQKIIERYGDTQQARAVARKWLLDRVMPGAGAAAAYVYGRNGSPVFRETKGGIAYSDDIDAREIDVAAGEEDEYYESGEMFRNNTRAPHSARSEFMRNFDTIDGGLAPLPGSARGTAAPDAPLGPIDSTLPKSSPLLPPAPPAPNTTTPGTGVFTDRLRGDALSERSDMVSSRVRRTTIAPPPENTYAIPTTGTTRRNVTFDPPAKIATPPTPAEITKRKAENTTTHQSRDMEAQIPQNYDPTLVPSMPSSVNANSSVQWKEYTAPYSGYNVPLTDAPNLVGIGYDAETAERNMAEHATANNDKEVIPEQPPRASPPSTLSTPTWGIGKEAAPPTDVNPANETNPAMRNAKRAKPTMGGEQPQGAN